MPGINGTSYVCQFVFIPKTLRPNRDDEHPDTFTSTCTSSLGPVNQDRPSSVSESPDLKMEMRRRMGTLGPIQ